MQQQPEPVVGEVAEAKADSLDALDEQVDGFGGAVAGSVGGEVGEQLVLPGGDGAGQAVQLGHRAVGAGGVEGEQPRPGLGEVAGAVDVAQLLGGDPRGRDLPVLVAGGQAGEQSPVAGRGVVLRPAEQDPPDPVQGVAASAPVPEALLLDAAADSVDRVLRQLDRVERVMPTSA